MKRIFMFTGLLLMLPLAVQAGGYTRLQGDMPLVGTNAGAPLPKGFKPAPVPNPDIFAPRSTRAPVPGEPEFSAGLTQTGQSVRVDQGHAPGSGFSEDLQRRSRTTFGTRFVPGFALTVPLDK